MAVTGPTKILPSVFIDNTVSVIATRQMEGNYQLQQVASEVDSLIKDYNSLLCQSLSGVTPAIAT